MYAPLIEFTPPAPLDKKRPGGQLSMKSVDCKQTKDQYLDHVLTGNKRPEGPRVIVDTFTGMGGGPELDWLELRLHELDHVADYVVVIESRFGNQGDEKMLHFTQQKERFAEFMPRIIHGVTDDCKSY